MSNFKEDPFRRYAEMERTRTLIIEATAPRSFGLGKKLLLLVAFVGAIWGYRLVRTPRGREMIRSFAQNILPAKPASTNAPAEPKAPEAQRPDAIAQVPVVAEADTDGVEELAKAQAARAEVVQRLEASVGNPAPPPARDPAALKTEKPGTAPSP